MNITLKLDDTVNVGDLEISYDNYLEARELAPNGTPDMLVVFSLTLKKGENSKKFDFSFHPELEKPVETWEGYQVSFIDGSSYDIDVKIEYKNSKKGMKPNEFKEKVEFKRLGVILDGDSLVEEGLTKIKGIGRRIAQVIIRVVDMDPTIRIGALSAGDIRRIEEIIIDPNTNNIHEYLFNRMRDIRTGSNKHLVKNSLDITVKRDIDRMIRIASKQAKRVRRGLHLYERKVVENSRRINEKDIKIALDKILSLMVNKEREELRVKNIYLMEIFSKNLLLPDLIEFRPEVVKSLKDKGLIVKNKGEFIIFSTK